MIKLNLVTATDYIHDPDIDLRRYVQSLDKEVRAPGSTNQFGIVENIIEWNGFKVLGNYQTSYGYSDHVIEYFFRPLNYNGDRVQPLCVRWKETGWSWDRVCVIRPHKVGGWTREDEDYGEDYVWPDKS